MEHKTRGTVVLVLCDFDFTFQEIASYDPRFILSKSFNGYENTELRYQIVGIVVRSGVTLDKAVLDRFPRLRFIIRAGSGLDNIDVGELEQRGIQLFRNADFSAVAVAELAFASLVMLARRIPESMALLRCGIWKKSSLVGESITGLNIAIWGAGPVGKACYDLLRPQSREVIFASWHSLPSTLNCLSPKELLAYADVHILCLPKRNSTIRIINDSFLHDVRHRGPYIINVGRFELLDFDSVISNLREKKLRGLFVDPVEKVHVQNVSKVLQNDESGLNLVMAQHLGPQRKDVTEKMGKWVLEVVERLLPT
jgi:D-3-phosphoglycerate dehydrogenase / 2-oxoglutarate reductase